MALNLAQLSEHVKTAGSFITSTELATTKANFDTQLSLKEDIVTGAISTIIDSPLTINKVLISNSLGKIEASNVDSDKLLHLSNVTSNIQTDIDSKQSSGINGAVSNIISSNLTANRVLITNANGKVVESDILDTELEMLSSVTSDISSQLTNILNKTNTLNNIFINSGTIKKWIAPTAIASITSQSSLANHILVVNKETIQRLTLTSVDPLHSSSSTTLIQSLQVTVGGVTTTLNLANSGIVVNTDNKTIDFNYTASSLADHIFTLNLKDTNITYISTTYTTLTISVLSSMIFQYPIIGTTNKNSPHDTEDVTVGQSISMTTAFSETLHNDISASIVISDGSTNPTVTSSISGSNLNYSFIVSNDSDHSATIILNLGATNNSYSWSAGGLLTAVDDIYTFPNIVSYDGNTINGYETGIHLLTDIANSLVLTFSGGDKLHSNTYSEQLSSLTYKIGTNGSLVTVDLVNDVTINASNETITIGNIVVTSVDNVYLYVTLLGPDSTVIDGALSILIPASQVKLSTPNWMLEATHHYYVPNGLTSTPPSSTNRVLLNQSLQAASYNHSLTYLSGSIVSSANQIGGNNLYYIDQPCNTWTSGLILSFGNSSYITSYHIIFLMKRSGPSNIGEFVYNQTWANVSNGEITNFDNGWYRYGTFSLGRYPYRSEGYSSSVYPAGLTEDMTGYHLDLQDYYFTKAGAPSQQTWDGGGFGYHVTPNQFGTEYGYSYLSCVCIKIDKSITVGSPGHVKVYSHNGSGVLVEGSKMEWAQGFHHVINTIQIGSFRNGENPQNVQLYEMVVKLNGTFSDVDEKECAENLLNKWLPYLGNV